LPGLVVACHCSFVWRRSADHSKPTNSTATSLFAFSFGGVLVLLVHWPRPVGVHCRSHNCCPQFSVLCCSEAAVNVYVTPFFYIVYRRGLPGLFGPHETRQSSQVIDSSGFILHTLAYIRKRCISFLLSVWRISSASSEDQRGGMSGGGFVREAFRRPSGWSSGWEFVRESGNSSAGIMLRDRTENGASFETVPCLRHVHTIAPRQRVLAKCIHDKMSPYLIIIMVRKHKNIKKW